MDQALNEMEEHGAGIADILDSPENSDQLTNLEDKYIGARKRFYNEMQPVWDYYSKTYGDPGALDPNLRQKTFQNSVDLGNDEDIARAKAAGVPVFAHGGNADHVGHALHRMGFASGGNLRGLAEGGSSEDESSMSRIVRWAASHVHPNAAEDVARTTRAVVEPFYGQDPQGKIRFLGGYGSEGMDPSLFHPEVTDSLRSSLSHLKNWVEGGKFFDPVPMDKRLSDLKDASQKELYIQPPKTFGEHVEEHAGDVLPIPGLAGEKAAGTIGKLAEELPSRGMSELLGLMNFTPAEHYGQTAITVAPGFAALDTLMSKKPEAAPSAMAPEDLVHRSVPHDFSEENQVGPYNPQGLAGGGRVEDLVRLLSKLVPKDQKFVESNSREYLGKLANANWGSNLTPEEARTLSQMANYPRAGQIPNHPLLVDQDLYRGLRLLPGRDLNLIHSEAQAFSPFPNDYHYKIYPDSNPHGYRPLLLNLKPNESNYLVPNPFAGEDEYMLPPNSPLRLLSSKGILRIVEQPGPVSGGAEENIFTDPRESNDESAAPHFEEHAGGGEVISKLSEILGHKQSLDEALSRLQAYLDKPSLDTATRENLQTEYLKGVAAHHTALDQPGPESLEALRQHVENFNRLTAPHETIGPAYQSPAPYTQRQPAGLQFGTTGPLVEQQKKDSSKFVLSGEGLSEPFLAPTTQMKPTNPIDQGKVTNMMEQLKAGQDMPPVLIDKTGNILDGNHRVEAANRLGIQYVPTLQITGGEDVPAGLDIADRALGRAKGGALAGFKKRHYGDRALYTTVPGTSGVDSGGGTGGGAGAGAGGP